jgi:hypothetical protein
MGMRVRERGRGDSWHQIPKKFFPCCSWLAGWL